MSATETKLGLLHDMTASALMEAMKGEIIPGYEDPETGELIPDRVLPPSAAIIQAAAKFLKDNEITCAPSEDNALGELEQIVQKRQERRANKADRMVALDQAHFMARPN